LTNVGGTTRIIAAVGVRGFATPVQYNLDQNGANGLYKGTMPANGCPTDFTLISRNDNGFVFGTQVPAALHDGAPMNAGSGVPVREHHHRHAARPHRYCGAPEQS
jgi:hypothetical protein